MPRCSSSRDDTTTGSDGSGKSAYIKVDVTFEDGRKGVLEGDVEIRDLAPHPGAGAARPLRKAS